MQPWATLPSMAAAGYVGIEPEAAGWLAGAAENGSDEVGAAARRVAALFEEAGESDSVSSGLRELESWLNGQAADVRRRAALAAVAPVAGADPTCQVPWTDPLVRAAKAVWRNASRPVMGAANSVGETAGLVWQLVPVNGGWQQAWVDLGAGVAAAWDDPRAAGVAMLNYETLDEEGFSYWIGGFIPDIAGLFLGGAGAGKLAARAAEKSADLAHVAKVRRVTAATDRSPWGGFAPSLPPYARPRPLRDWSVERRARAEVRAEDLRADGHTVARHGPRTTLRSQWERAYSGLKPDGEDGFPTHAARFFRWEDQAEAIRKAKAQWRGEGELPIDLHRPVGEGYMTDIMEYRRTTEVLVRFDGDGNVYTAYPLLPKGGPVR